MKKTAALLVSLIMILSSFTACDKKEESKSDKNSSGSSSAPAPSDKAAAGSQTNGNLPIADNAVDFAANMKLGWNLGNTLDANGSNSLESETSWGQPMVTKQLIDYIKQALHQSEFRCHGEIIQILISILTVSGCQE